MNFQRCLKWGLIAVCVCVCVCMRVFLRMCVCLFFETRSQYVGVAGLELSLVFLALISKYWDLGVCHHAWLCQALCKHYLYELVYG